MIVEVYHLSVCLLVRLVVVTPFCYKVLQKKTILYEVRGSNVQTLLSISLVHLSGNNPVYKASVVKSDIQRFVWVHVTIKTTIVNTR